MFGVASILMLLQGNWFNIVCSNAEIKMHAVILPKLVNQASQKQSCNVVGAMFIFRLAIANLFR